MSAPRRRFPAGRSPEHRAAFAQLRALAALLRLRVLADAEGFPVIPGRSGQVEWCDPAGGSLAVFTDRSRLIPKLLALPGVRAHQRGERELRAVFPPEALADVAHAIQAKRRRSNPTPAQMSGLRPRHSITSRAQDRT